MPGVAFYFLEIAMSEEYFDDESTESVVGLEPSPLLAPIRTDVIALNENTDPEVLMLTLGMCKNYLAELKQLKGLVESAMIERIKAHGVIPVSPTVFYTVGKDKTTKPKDLKAAVEMLWDTSGGDFTRFVECLSSNALKPGSVKRLFTAQQFNDCFEVTEREKIVEGKVKKVDKLCRVDKKFMK